LLIRSRIDIGRIDRWKDIRFDFIDFNNHGSLPIRVAGKVLW
jgi:hypothetical protein